MRFFEHVTKKDVAIAVAIAVAPPFLEILRLPGFVPGVVDQWLVWFAANGVPFFLLALLVANHARRVEARLAEVEADVGQIEPMIALSKLIDAKRALPPMREYAIAPDFALILYELVRDVAPKQIVETGSGVSTLICAYALEKNGGDGKVLALDHDAGYAARTRQTLARHGLSHRATVVHAPLVETSVNGVKGRWYSQEALAAIGSIDLVVDDGPPKYVGANARYASLPTLAPRMTKGALFVLDYVGDEERAVVARWCRELAFEAEWLATRKGNVILHPSETKRRT